VNAGDGAHEHPTQALLDALTLRQRKGRLKGLRVAIVGDILHSRVARSNVWLLTKMGAEVVLSDPEAMETGKVALAPESKKHGDRLRFSGDAYAALEGADALLVVTEWNEYRGADLDRIKKALKAPVVFDGRNVFDPKTMRASGFTYRGVGRP